MTDLKCEAKAAQDIIDHYGRDARIVYVSGPITSGFLKDLPFTDRMQANCIVLGRWAEKAVRWFLPDHKFINPAIHQVHGDMSWPPESWDVMWRKVIEELNVTDAVLTPGWSESTGCRHEIQVMLTKGVNFWQATDVGPVLLSPYDVHAIAHGAP